MPSLAEVLRLAVALALLPVMIRLSRQTRFSAGRPYYGAALTAIYASMLLTVLEELFLTDVLNLLQHSLYLVAGVAAILATRATRREVLRQAGRA